MVAGKPDEAAQLDEESTFGPSQFLMADVILRLHDPAHIPVFLLFSWYFSVSSEVI